MTTLRVRFISSLSAKTCDYREDAIVSLDGAGNILEVVDYDGRPVDEDLRHSLLVPGFVDAHLHFPQTRVIGHASGPLLPWLDQVVFPEEARFSDTLHAEQVADLFCEQMVRAGTTLSFIYSSVHPDACDALFKTLDRRGLRAIAGPVLMDQGCPESLKLGVDEAIAGLERLRAAWHGERLQLAVIPRFAISCTPELLAAGADFANRHGLRVSTHISENVDECRLTEELFEASDYLQVYEDAGLIHARCVLAHAIHLSESEWTRLQEKGAVVAHCPDSNRFLGSGAMPVGEVLARDIPVTVGSDVAAGRTFSIPAVLAAAFDNARAQSVDLPLETLLYWGTLGGARALGFPNVGKIAPGMAADLTLIELPTWVRGAKASLGSLLFDRDGTRVTRTWVQGKEVYRA